ncbi:MAG: CRISPR-associated protein Cas4 [Candidatus Helarchaeota archaeon]|nr:CRISPR-associated protein Cas4 [Candidatus Helarchaeota archaeon]
MFSIALKDLINPRKIDELDRQADSEIKLRGYDLKAKVPSDLKTKEWYLPVNEIVSDFCPSERYFYLRKYRKEVPRQLTWTIFKGRVIDDLYEDLFKKFQKYVSSTHLKQLYIKENLEKYREGKLVLIRDEIEKQKDSMIRKPAAEEIENVLKNIDKLLRFECQICGTILDFKISMKKDINLKSEVALLFSFTFKPKIYSLDLGFTEGISPDFLYGQRTIGEIKTGVWKDMFNLSCAAYALAYENENQKNMNLMIVLNPSFDINRTVPLYPNLDAGIIHDRYRKAVITLRNRRIELIKKNKDPGLPDDRHSCVNCCYYNFCWRENGKG